MFLFLLLLNFTFLYQIDLHFVCTFYLFNTSCYCTRSAYLANEKQCFMCNCLFVYLFVPSLSFCHEKATVALYFERIRTRLGVIHFRVFWLFLRLLTT